MAHSRESYPAAPVITAFLPSRRPMMNICQVVKTPMHNCELRIGYRWMDELAGELKSWRRFLWHTKISCEMDLLLWCRVRLTSKSLSQTVAQSPNRAEHGRVCDILNRSDVCLFLRFCFPEAFIVLGFETYRGAWKKPAVLDDNISSYSQIPRVDESEPLRALSYDIEEEVLGWNIQSLQYRSILNMQRFFTKNKRYVCNAVLVISSTLFLVTFFCGVDVYLLMPVDC